MSECLVKIPTDSSLLGEDSSPTPPKISVIVPVYKVEKYLPECIDSVLAQTFTDFELILVDDGSPDNSGKICDEYASRDSRILVFHKKNGGVSSARNLGLDNAQGEWVVFLDGDDTFSREYLSSFAAEFPIHPDLITSSILTIDCGGKIVDHALFERSVVEWCDDGRSQKTSMVDWSFLWQMCIGGKLFRRRLLERYKIRFDSRISLGEDQLFLSSFLSISSRVVVVSTSGYFYLWEPGRGSLTTRNQRDPREEYLLAFLQEGILRKIKKRVRIPRSVWKKWEHYMVWQHYNAALVGMYSEAKRFLITGREAVGLLRYIYRYRVLSLATCCHPRSLEGKLFKWMGIVFPLTVFDWLLRTIYRPQFKKTAVVAMNFATGSFMSKQRWNSWSARTLGKCDRVFEFSWNDIPSKFKEDNRHIFSIKRGSGLWLWKPYCILRSLEELPEGSILIYSDSGCIFVRDVANLISTLNRDGVDIMLFENPTLEKCFTKREVFGLTNTPEEYADLNQIQASFIVLRKTEKTVEFIKKWLQMAQDIRLLSAIHTQPHIPEFPEYVAHREDQSILSLLAKNEGITCYRDPSQYGERPWEYAGKEHLVQFHSYENSNFPTTFFLYRKANLGVAVVKEIVKKCFYATGIMSREKFLKRHHIPEKNIVGGNK